MLVHIAIGDAYGAGFEYIVPEAVPELNDGRRYIKHPTHNLQPGQYTDDTQMSIAIAECMLEDSISDQLAVAHKFVEVFERDPRDGYSRGLQGLLEEVSKLPRDQWGAALLARIDAHGRSSKNGAAMRAMPLGLYADSALVASLARKQGAITHQGTAVDAGVASALAVNFAREHPLADLPGRLDACFGEANHKFSVPWTGPVMGKNNDNLGIDTVRAAVTAVVSSATLSEVLTHSIAFTGDVDTVAAIAMGIACVSPLDNDLPDYLFRALERGGQFGLDYLSATDRALDLHLGLKSGEKPA